MTATLHVHGRLARSSANGPGVRSVVWTQGCTLRCPGCFNPQTHAPAGEPTPVDELVVWACGNDVDGVTISGGEPLQQPTAVVPFARGCRAAGLSVILFTGFSWRYLALREPQLVSALAECVDVVLAGRYVRAQHLGSGLRGSANKTIELLSSRYRADEIDSTPSAEVVIRPDGSRALTGIDPLTIEKEA